MSDDTDAWQLAAGERESFGRTVVLPDICDMEAAISLKAQFAALVGSEDLCVDAGAVTRCGSPLIQVLLAAAAAQMAAGRPFHLQNTSPNLRMAVAELGLVERMVAWEAP